MIDIVEQRRQAKEYNLFDADVYEQAADEIERLRESLRQKDDIDFIIDSHGMSHFSFTIVYKSMSKPNDI